MGPVSIGVEIQRNTDGDTPSRLYVVGKGHSHEAVYDFVEETESGHRSSLFKGLPAQLRQLVSCR